MLELHGIVEREQGDHSRSVDVTTVRSDFNPSDLSALLELAPDAMVITDDCGRIAALNEQAVALFGYERSDLAGRQIEVLVPARLRTRHIDHRTGYLADPFPRALGDGFDLFGRRRDGSEFLIELSLSPVDFNGTRMIVSSIRDVTARRRIERDASHFAAVVESSHDAIIGKDLEGRIVSWNKGAQELFDYTAAEAVGSSISMLVPVGVPDELPEVLERVRAGERVDDYETVRARRDGTRVEVSLTISPILGRDDSVVGASTIARDISEQLRHQSRLQYIAEHDPLTGVRNRRRFELDVAEQVARAHRFGERAALLVIDVDNFKLINDQLGHHAGDDALQMLARAITDQLAATHMVARLGGDEFAVLAPYADLGRAQQLAEALNWTVAQLPPPGGDRNLRLSVSIGLSLINADTASDEEVLVAADRAMYAEKTRRH